MSIRIGIFVDDGILFRKPTPPACEHIAAAIRHEFCPRCGVKQNHEDRKDRIRPAFKTLIRHDYRSFSGIGDLVMEEHTDCFDGSMKWFVGAYPEASVGEGSGGEPDGFDFDDLSRVRTDVSIKLTAIGLDYDFADIMLWDNS